MKFINNGILLILIGIILGILGGEQVVISQQCLFLIGVILLITNFIHLFLASRNPSFRQGYALHLLLVSIFTGFLTAFLHNPTQKHTHYIHHLAENQLYTFCGHLTEEISSSAYGVTYRVRLFQANDQNISGDMLCFFRRESLTEQNILEGNGIVFMGMPSSFSEVKNPNQFDYKQYINRKGIFWRVEATTFELVKTASGNGVLGVAQKLRRYLSQRLDASNFSEQNIGLLKALLLGHRSGLDEAVYQHFIDSGTVHLLAISGLHVGVVVTILLFFIGKLPRRGTWKVLRFLLLLVGLWGFAFLAGLSASVMRAVTMFSFVGVGLLLKKQQGRFDALMLSMLFLLLIRPNFLFDVGFQLSYAAVFAILAFFPKLNRIEFKNKLLSYTWKLFIVGFSAQIGVLPISLYYFHQFPILFFIGNLLMVPLLFPILVLGFSSLILVSFDWLPNLLIFALEALLNFMYFAAKTVALQEGFIIRGIYFDTYMLYAATLMLLALLIWLETRKSKHLKVLLCCILVFQGCLFHAKYQIQTDRKNYIFHLPKNTAISVRNGKQITIYQSKSVSEKTIATYLKNSGATQVHFASLPSVLEIKKYRLLVIDSLGVYPENEKIDIVLLSNSPKINLERMLTTITPTWVVADGSNFPWLVARWENTCKTSNVSFHNTAKQGRFLID